MQNYVGGHLLDDFHLTDEKFILTFIYAYHMDSRCNTSDLPRYIVDF
jgi:hypothetical protein